MFRSDRVLKPAPTTPTRTAEYGGIDYGGEHLVVENILAAEYVLDDHLGHRGRPIRWHLATFSQARASRCRRDLEDPDAVVGQRPKGDSLIRFKTLYLGYRRPKDPAAAVQVHRVSSLPHQSQRQHPSALGTPFGHAPKSHQQVPNCGGPRTDVDGRFKVLRVSCLLHRRLPDKHLWSLASERPSGDRLAGRESARCTGGGPCLIDVRAAAPRSRSAPRAHAGLARPNRVP